jgi:hypothetical protein
LDDPTRRRDGRTGDASMDSESRRMIGSRVVVHAG